MSREYSTIYSQIASEPVSLRSSTPIQSPGSRSEELQRLLSKKTLDNELLAYENEQLRKENEQLKRELQEKEILQSHMRQQMEVVTNSALSIYDRLRTSKARYYEKHGINACAYDYPAQQEK